MNPSLRGPEIQRLVARRLIRSLTRGTAVADGVQYIHVGHDKWLAAQTELMDEIAEDGYSDTKFVRGAYGAGKSHFLSVVQDRARSAGWATSHVECKVEHVEIDRLETLYPAIVANLVTNDLLEHSDADSVDDTTEPMRFLLDRWSAGVIRDAGIRDEAVTRPFDAENRVHRRLQKLFLRSNLPPQFTKALSVYARAVLGRDEETLYAISGWLRGEPDNVTLPSSYLETPSLGTRRATTHRVDLRPISKGTAADVMRGLLWLVHRSGYTGLVLCIDEIEELAKLRQKRRQDQALQALREFVDNAGGDVRLRHLCIYLAATPEMFESQEYFPRYDALATRIQPVGKEINWRGPVIDLDRTPLSKTEMHRMALQIWRVHQAAYGPKATGAMNESSITSFVDAVLASRVRIAKPRLLARLLVDQLERARQVGRNYTPPSDLDKAVSDTASNLDDER